MCNLCIECRFFQSYKNCFLSFSFVVIGKTRTFCYKLFRNKVNLFFRRAILVGLCSKQKYGIKYTVLTALNISRTSRSYVFLWFKPHLFFKSYEDDLTKIENIKLIKWKNWYFLIPASSSNSRWYKWISMKNDNLWD